MIVVCLLAVGGCDDGGAGLEPTTEKEASPIDLVYKVSTLEYPRAYTVARFEDEAVYERIVRWVAAGRGLRAMEAIRSTDTLSFRVARFVRDPLVMTHREADHLVLDYGEVPDVPVHIRPDSSWSGWTAEQRTFVQSTRRIGAWERFVQLLERAQEREPNEGRP